MISPQRILAKRAWPSGVPGRIPFWAALCALGMMGGCRSSDARDLYASATPRACVAGETGGTTVTLLGTAGGPIHRRLRSQPASLLSVDGEHYLVDAGDGVARQLTQAGIAIPEVKQVFLTHLHADHVTGLAPLFIFAWTSAMAHPMTVYGPPGTKHLVEAALSYIETPVNIHRLQYPPVAMPIDLFTGSEPAVSEDGRPSLIYEDDVVSVYAVENSHYATMSEVSQSYGADRSYSYRFDTSDRSVVFSGDTGPSNSLMRLAEGADILVIEVIDLERQFDVVREMSGLPDDQLTVVMDHMAEEHITPDQIGLLAAKAAVGQVILTHVVPGLDSEQDMTAYINGVRQHYHGPVHLGFDLACF